MSKFIQKYSFFNIAIVLSAIVQLFLCFIPDTMGDLDYYRGWLVVISNLGLEEVYWTSPLLKGKGLLVDYPPLYPYILYLVGLLIPKHELYFDNVFFLNSILKFINVLGYAIFSFFLIKINFNKVQNKWVWILIFFNPALVFNGAYWGQTDIFCIVFLVTSFYYLKTNLNLSITLFVLAILFKPLALPFGLLYVVFAFKLNSFKVIFKASVISLFILLILFIPFIMIGRSKDIIIALITQTDAMPFVSLNAHNTWWLITGGLPWVNADIKLLNIITYRHIGILVFIIIHILVIFKIVNTKIQKIDMEYIFSIFTLIGFSFFMVLTHMHENHILYALAGSLILVLLNKKYIVFSILFCFSSFFSLALHDPYLVSVGIFDGGQTIIENDMIKGGNYSVLRNSFSLFFSVMNLTLILYFCFLVKNDFICKKSITR